MTDPATRLDREAVKGSQLTHPTSFNMALRAILILCMVILLPAPAISAPYAAMVVDARSGKVLHSRNADTRLHPASLTKMMTLYVVFDAVEKGEITLDTRVKISRKAAAEPPSKLGLRAGSEVRLRHLIRAAAIKSANDAATALGEAISGSEAAFARRMTRMAKAMGMTKTTFKNAHGLTESGHMSTARDMTTLGRHLFYDFPEYYNIFSRRSTDAGIKKVHNTNRRFLNAYRGADGIKTGYTRAAGFNLVASAERGGERIIATMFGGRSTAQRNARVAELLNMGFERAPRHVAVVKPRKPILGPEGTAGRVSRNSGIVARIPRPLDRPGKEPPAEVLVAMQSGIEAALAGVVTPPPADAPPAAPPEVLAASLASGVVSPRPRPVIAEGAAEQPRLGVGEVVTRITSSGGRHWAVNVGLYSTRHEAEKVLLKTALVEIETLQSALRRVEKSPQGFEANFLGLSEQNAALVCRRLHAQDMPCDTRAPG